MQKYDAIVVGSGISGGWAAKELTEKGLKVLLLERGMDIEHVKDYKSAGKPRGRIPHRGRQHQRDEAQPPGAETRLSATTRIQPRMVGQRSRIPTPRSSASTGCAAITSAALAAVGPADLPLERPRFRGQRQGRVSASTGRSATPTSRPGTTTSSASPASAAPAKACRSCPTASSCRRWR